MQDSFPKGGRVNDPWFRIKDLKFARFAQRQRSIQYIPLQLGQVQM
jgi:hypothetical protein